MSAASFGAWWGLENTLCQKDENCLPSLLVIMERYTRSKEREIIMQAMNSVQQTKSKLKGNHSKQG